SPSSGSGGRSAGVATAAVPHADRRGSSALAIGIVTHDPTSYRVAASAAMARDAATGPGPATPARRSPEPGPLFDHSAGDAIARVPGGIGFIVVFAGMDHDRRSVV